MRYQVMGTGRVTQAVMSGILLFAAVCAAGIAAEQPDVRAVKITERPVLDGKLDEPFWQKTDSYGEFALVKGEGKRTDATEFKVAFDDTWLYFGVRCANDQLHRFTPKHHSYEDPVHTDDSIELFLDPGGDGRVYFHYMLSYNNIHAEQIVRGGVKDRNWNVPWLSATARDAGGWSAEIAIPLFLLASYGAPDRMTFNIARNQRLIKDRDGQGEILSDMIVSGAWRPIVKGFHEPDRFAALRLAPPEKLNVPLLASLENAVVKPFEMRDDGSGYSVEIMVRNASDRSGELEAVVSDVTVDGIKGEARQAFLVGAAPQTQIIRVPAKSMAERDVTITLRDPATGAEMGRRVVTRPQSLRMMTAYLDRNYYTDEQNASVVAELGLPPENIKGMKLVVRSGGKDLGEAAAAVETRIVFPIASWSNGTHAVTVDLRRGDGAVFFSSPLALIKRPPRPGHEWKIDHVNRVILQNGKPFFGIGMIMSVAGYDPERITRQVAASGFNTYFMWMNWDDPNRGWSGFTTEDVHRHAALAEKHGLYFIARPEAAFGGPKGEYDGEWVRPYFATLTPEQVAQEKKLLPTYSMLRIKGVVYKRARGLSDAQKDALVFGHYQYHLGSMLEGIEAVKQAGNLFGYFAFDEPCQWQFSSLLDFYRKINDADGYHPQFVLFSGAPPKDAEDKSFYDVLGQDPYWAPGGAGFRGWPRYVAAATASLHQRAAARRAPAWIVLEAEMFRGCRPLTTAEQECQAWLGIMNGATMICYFRSDDIATRATWDTFAGMNKTIMGLAPALTAPEVKQTVEYQRGRRAASGGEVEYEAVTFDAEKWIYPDVQAVLKRFPDGRATLLAANLFDRPTRCEFVLPGLAGPVSNRLTGAAHEVKDGKFADDFRGYGIAAYDLELPVGGPVAIKVSSIVNTGDVKASETPFILSNYVRPGRKNVLPNPSFEEATRPGYPDYFVSYGAVDPDRTIGSQSAPVWGQVTNEAFHGKYSMLISCPSTNTVTYRHGPAGARFYCQPQHDVETVYTFSFYARTDTPGLRLGYHSEYGDGEFKLTADWKRYSMPWKVPPRSDADLFSFGFCRNQAGKVWLDAMQVEKGVEATEFEE